MNPINSAQTSENQGGHSSPQVGNLSGRKATPVPNAGKTMAICGIALLIGIICLAVAPILEGMPLIAAVAGGITCSIFAAAYLMGPGFNFFISLTEKREEKKADN